MQDSIENRLILQPKRFISRQSGEKIAKTPKNLASRIAGLSVDDLERAIRRAYHAMLAASTISDRAAACSVMFRLIKARSSETIQRMERERGLTAAVAKKT